MFQEENAVKIPDEFVLRDFDRLDVFYDPAFAEGLEDEKGTAVLVMVLARRGGDAVGAQDLPQIPDLVLLGGLERLLASAGQRDAAIEWIERQLSSK